MAMAMAVAAALAGPLNNFHAHRPCVSSNAERARWNAVFARPGNIHFFRVLAFIFSPGPHRAPSCSPPLSRSLRHNGMPPKQSEPRNARDIPSSYPSSCRAIRGRTFVHLSAMMNTSAVEHVLRRVREPARACGPSQTGFRANERRQH